ncbi:TonB-dependent receptor [Mariniflexile litorale]|uniref:TonB-dependent receptor n=1 Tax=Mariniflexile litorale TaxID=3045158 RepID=A0AAU7EE00_9FLAO|nr:TonB-dependent receptor [Mariniflexile sp. KMM 9835]MDQ8213469.1 TonB-dependent receptor [Mariniflexile sp. KMM 9835]
MSELKNNQLKLKFLSGTIWIMALLVSAFSVKSHANTTNSYILNIDEVQNVAIKGEVVSAIDNLPLPGVNITVKGTGIGSVTDFDGKYSLNVPSSESVLVITYLGYKTVEIKVGDQKMINVSLVEDISTLDEVVIVGYGEKKKESLTGAIEQIKSDVFEDRAVTSPALSLQGQTPGLTVTRNSPRPGQEGIGLQIRGATSVNGGEPLIIIDGAPAVGTEFYQMNPDDIESISILKDGSASIYGSRASNGVLLVTTKKGKGKMKIEYTGNYRYNVIGIRPPVPSMEEYATLWLEAAQQDGATRDYWGWGTEENLLRLQNGDEGIYSTDSWGDIFIGDANRFDELFGDSESYQHNLSLSGSTDNTRYRLSAAIADNLGALKTAYDGQKQQNVRFNYDFDVTDRLKIQSGITYQKGKISGPSTGLDATAGSQDPPFFPAYNPYGQWYANFGIAGNRNSTAATTDGGRKDQLDKLAKINFGASYNIIKGLDFRANASYTDLNRRKDEYRLTVQPYTWDGQISPERINTSPLVKAEVLNRTYEIYGAFLDYKISTENGHNFAFMLGLTAERQKEKALYAERAGLQDLGVYDLNAAPIDNIKNSGGSNHWGIYSTISRFNYDYKEKYLLELVGRRDGSSRFAENFKFSNFGSITAGWLISSEKFMENTPINYLKIRGSYGISGNQVGIGLYDYVSSIGTGALPFGSSPVLQNTAYVNGLTSRTRTWEEVKMRNIGLDLGVFQNKLTGSFDLYQKDNNGMLIDVIYPAVLGGTAPKSNSGKLTTTGWEAILGWKETKGDFSYSISVNMSDNNNELVNMEGATEFEAGLVTTREGYPLNSYFLYKTDGLFQTQAEIDDYYAVYTGVKQGELPIQTDATQNIRIGDTKKVDSDGNGYIDDVGGEGDTGDAIFMGDAAPHYIYGINLGASYKGFDFTAFFQGVLEQNVVRSGWLRYPFAQIWTNQTTSYLGKTWTPENTGAAYPRMTSNTTRSAYNWENNDFLLQNNRYMRLKSIVLGYTVPQILTEKTGFSKVRVYFSGNDLFEWTSIKDGYDPEFGESTQTVYPFSRTYSFGVNLSF